jgi:hypothetical protein
MDNLDAKGICDIIRACDKAGVKQLKLGDMCVTFVEESKEVTPWTGLQNPPVFGSSQADQTEKEPVPQTLMTSEQKDMLRQIEENQLMIDDPMGFEQRMIDSEMFSAQPLEGTDA